MKILFRSKASYISRIVSMGPILYLPLDEASGTAAVNKGSLGVASNGTYSGVDLWNTAGPFGKGAPYWDGANDYMLEGAAGFKAAFNGQEGSFFCWMKVHNAAVWTDGTLRVPIILWADATNYMYMQKSTTNNQFLLKYVADSVAKTLNFDPISETDWFPVAMTWSLLADQLICYLNGVQYGSTITGLGTWGASPVGNLFVGAYDATPQKVWDGYLAHFAVWDRPLSAEEVNVLSV